MAGIGAGGNAALQLRGAKELARGLKRAGADMKDLRAVNRQAAQVVVPAAKAIVPERSGRLKRTIRAGSTQRAGVVRAGNNGRVPYAGPINYGWRKRHIKPTRFMNRAARSTEPQWTQIYRDAVQRIIDTITEGDIS